MNPITYFKSYVASIKPSDRVAIFHHVDGDGICAGFITAEAIRRMHNIEPKLIPLDYGQMRDAKHVLRKIKNFDKTIAVDLNLDEVKEIVENIPNLLVLDHHPRSLARDNIIKSEDLKSHYYPASIMAYDLFSKLINISDLDYIAAAGVIDDMGYQQNKAFIDATAKKYNIKIGKDVFESKLGKVGLFIAFSNVVTPSRMSEAFKIMASSKAPDDVLNSPLKEIFYKIDSEIKKWVNKFDELAEKHDDLYLYDVNPKYKVKGDIVSILSQKYPHQTIITYQHTSDKIIASARRHDKKLKVNDLLKRAIKGFEKATAGEIGRAHV